jgi:hypothetical protein
MRLDTAVFLVAPKPKPPSMPTRRAFLLAGGTFAIGSVLGAACGYSAGVERAKAAPTDAAAPGVEEDLKPSGDVELDELRRLAVKAPIEELMARANLLVACVRAEYKHDAILWRGVERVADALIAGASVPGAPVFPRFVAQVIEVGDPSLTKNLRPKIQALRQLK